MDNNADLVPGQTLWSSPGQSSGLSNRIVPVSAEQKPLDHVAFSSSQVMKEKGGRFWLDNLDFCVFTHDGAGAGTSFLRY
jgi:hypothetical protein